MGFFGDFFSGATELPREVLGGIATAAGADKNKVEDTLGLHPDTQELWETVVNHPGKVLGELAMYSILPARLFGSAYKAAKLGSKVAKKTSKAVGKRAAATADIANQAATMGTYGVIGEEAKAALQEREAHPLDTFVTDALLVGATLGAFKAAHKAAKHIKNKAVKNKYIKEYLLDTGVNTHDAELFAKGGEATRIKMIKQLERNAGGVLEALDNAYKDQLRSAKIVPEMRTTDAFAETNIASGLRDQTQRPVIPVREVKVSPIDKNASEGIARLRAGADDMEAHRNIIANRVQTLKNDINQALPEDSKMKVLRWLDGEKVKLHPWEHQVAKQLRSFLDDVGEIGVGAGIFRGLRADYLPHILTNTKTGQLVSEEEVPSVIDKIDSYLTEKVGKSKHTSYKTKHALERKIDIPLSKVEEATDGLYKPVTTDLAEIMQLYVTDLGRAVSMRNVLRNIDTSLLSKTAKEGWVPVKYPTLMKAWKEHTNSRKLPDQLYAHPDFAPSLKLIFEGKDMDTVMKAVVFANFASKRALIYGSLFHFNALSESALFAAAGGFGAVAKGAGAGFLISGGNPLGAAVGASMGAGLHVLVRTKDIVRGLSQGNKQTQDMIEYALRYVEIKPPRDIGNDEIYSGLASLQGIVDKYMPESIAKGAMKKGMSTATKINKAIDVLMWYRLMAGAKLIVFERELEKAIIANSKLPLEQQKSQHELAKMAGQFVNDAFGGQNWRKLAENVDNAFGRKWAAAMASENGMKWANLVMFAPDWTVSNLRVLAKVFPGIEKDPIARKMYQRYALRAAIYYATVGAGIQMMLTGKPIWENDDPTKLDLGDGRTMTFSKQVMEPFHWVKNPIHEATVKQSSLLKGIEEQVLNKEYIGGRAGPITTEDDPVFTAAGKRLKIAGQHFAPIFVQDIGRNGPEGVYGFFGHPIYGHIRYGFKKANGELE